ncbi:hypothetical protein CALCODRAFT_539648, partial [Calocera cornea HHB12733]
MSRSFPNFAKRLTNCTMIQAWSGTLADGEPLNLWLGTPCGQTYADSLGNTSELAMRATNPRST